MYYEQGAKVLSYLLIIVVCALVFHKIFKDCNREKLERENQQDDGLELVQAIARYETPQWKMAVATDGQMSQKEWDRTLTILTSNIQDLERV